jgi:hypothetical protein
MTTVRCSIAQVAATLLLAGGALPMAAQVDTPACGTEMAGATRIEGARYLVVFAPRPAPWALGRFVSLEFAVCPRPGIGTPGTPRVDARMPEHGHGMNYRPSVVPTGPGRWRAEGLLLHMAGRWELSFELGQDGLVERLTTDLQLH